MHSIYKSEHILKLHQQVGMVVKVTLIDKRPITGTVHSIDPVSGSIILLERASKTLQILMGHAVVSTEECPDMEADDTSKILSWPSKSGQSVSPVSAESVKIWLQKNRVTFEERENGILIVGGAVSLRAPYTQEMCTGDNELVVDRIRKVLSEMPRD